MSDKKKRFTADTTDRIARIMKEVNTNVSDEAYNAAERELAEQIYKDSEAVGGDVATLRHASKVKDLAEIGLLKSGHALTAFLTKDLLETVAKSTAKVIDAKKAEEKRLTGEILKLKAEIIRKDRLLGDLAENRISLSFK
jgi:hypothetical protein